MTRRRLIVAAKVKAAEKWCLPIMPEPILPPDISGLVARIMRENERAFCIVSDEPQEGGHPLPIYRVDENGKGVECGRADVLVVNDGLVVAIISGKASREFAEASACLGEGCLYYEFKDAKEEREMGPYEVSKRCRSLRIVQVYR